MEISFDLTDGTGDRYEINGIASDGSSRLLVCYTRHDELNGEAQGDFFRISDDNGDTFDPERSLPSPTAGETRIGIRFSFIPGGLAVVYSVQGTRGRNLVYTCTNTEGGDWREPVQINDEPNSVAVGLPSSFGFLQHSQGRISCGN